MTIQLHIYCRMQITYQYNKTLFMVIEEILRIPNTAKQVNLVGGYNDAGDHVEYGWSSLILGKVVTTVLKLDYVTGDGLIEEIGELFDASQRNSWKRLVMQES
ncbi:hypothetical protein C5167_023723 [Papaver somniferum]|uniref:Uncharacterized protein n=1 Tax=Papaver somniferum TaxID=3469 RepID=A0A4Y7JQF4_PAPSO|nr:hypothetical protein C5167_023723 [Papaver somniferum]